MKTGQLPSPNGKVLHIALLGGLDIRVAGKPIDVGYAKLGGLLAVMAMAAGPALRREYLAELLWPNMSAEAGRQNLRRALFNLKTAMGEVGPLLSTRRDTVALDRHHYWLDVADFTAAAPHDSLSLPKMEHLAELYRGEFMAGFYLPDCPDFEDWLQIQREALHRRALALLEQLANGYEQAGDLGRALQFALRHAEMEPWDERARRCVMRLYALNGQRGAAIAQFDTFCRLLKKELGVLPNAETRHLAERIRNGELRASPTAVAVEGKTVAPPLVERRQATVLYCELIPVAMDDPDDAMALLQAPQARCVDIIRRFSGHIVQTHGGGLLAYFGYPQAHEHATRHAVQAALAVTRESTSTVEIRVGVHTGLTMTSSAASIPDTVGKTSRLAIQLRQIAGSGEVLISEAAHRIVAGYFDCVSLGKQNLPDMGRPLEIFRVAGESGARTRLDAADRLTPLAGRRAEIAELMALWDAAAQGARHVVLLQGEAGIGKSRLLHTVKERLAGRPHAIRELNCFPEFSQSPFYPLIAMLESVLGFAHGDTPEIKSGKLAAYLGTHFPALARDAVPLLAPLLSLPHGAACPAAGLSPQKQKESTIAILLELLRTLAVRQPVLLIVEDLHWIDPSTLELLTGFVGRHGGESILAVFTARPEFIPPWPDTCALTLTLAPLAEPDVAQMIAALNGNMPAATVHRIVEHADGVPLFVEEMAKMATQDTGFEQPTGIPSTLHDLLAARMDRLGEAKYTAQLAATIGREFDPDVLRRVFVSAPAVLVQSLNTLQDAGLLLRVNETTCQFKHALIQEAAYQSLPRADRQAAHRRIAQTLLADFPDAVANQPELLARHLSSGGETGPAIEYWIKAGQRAVANSAIAEAIGHFNAGLQLVMSLPPDETRDRLESALRLNLGTALIAAQGYGSVEAGEAFTRALTLSEALSDSAGSYQALWGMWLTSSSRTDHTHALELAEKLLDQAERNNDPLQLQQALYAIGNSLLWTGQLAQARRHQERSIRLYQPAHHDAMVSAFGENVRISCGSLLTWVLWLQGYPEQACAVAEQTRLMASEVNHPYSQCYARVIYAGLTLWMRQVEKARQLSEETLAQANRHGFPLWMLSGSSVHGWALSMQGNATGIAPFQQAVAIMHVAMSGIEAYFMGMLGEACLHLGRLEEALTILNQTLAVMHAKNDRFLESEALRLKGECLLALADTNGREAESCFDAALAISRAQGAKSLELRAATSLARLWLKQGRPEDARRLLTEICSWFTEGLTSPDYLDAQGLLAG